LDRRMLEPCPRHRHEQDPETHVVNLQSIVQDARIASRVNQPAP